MNQHFQMCSYKGHEGNKVQFICLDVKCERKRSFCFKCLQENQHSHGKENNKNIYNQTAFEAFIKTQIEYLQNQDNNQGNDSFVQQCIKIKNVLIFQMDNISNILQELQTKSYLQKYIQSLESKLETISKTKLSQVNDEFISELVNFDINQKRQLMKQEIYEQCEQLYKNTQFLQQLSSKEIEIHTQRDSQCEVTQLTELSHQDLSNMSKDQFQGENNNVQKTSMCPIKGHEGKKIKFVCLDVECQLNKLVCSQCQVDNPHKHTIFDSIGLQAQIKSKIEQLQQQVQKVDDQFVQRCIAVIKEIQQQMNKILEIVIRIQTKPQLQGTILSLQAQLEILRKTKLKQIEENFIHQFTNISADFVLNQQCIKQEIENQCDQLMKSIIKLKQSYNQEGQALKIKYQFEPAQAYQLINYEVHTATISQDLKYIASSHYDRTIKLWNYQDFQLILDKKLSDNVMVSKFTDDSRLLYIGSRLGLLYCFDLYNNFKQIYTSKIHTNNLLNLFCITNHTILTSSFDAQIIKTNTIKDERLLVIEAHTQRIDGLDFNRAKDVIASCSEDNFIKLWNNENGKLLIQKQNNKSIFNQVLFINNIDQLVSLDFGNVQIWQIRYDLKELLLINTINDMVYNISLVLNQQFILSICDEYIKFYTNQGEYIHQIKHDIKEFQMMRQVQLDSITSIVVQGQKQLQIFRMKI